MKQEKVSIIIPTYKRSKFLKKAIESVRNQTYKNIEIIVVDDNLQNSEERKTTEKIMEEYSNIEEIVYLKNSINLGGSLSRNKGIERATGKFIAFLDDDDEYMPDKIEKQYNFYKEKFEKKDGFVYCSSLMLDHNLREIPRKIKNINGNKRALLELLKTGYTSTGCIFIPKKILLEVQGFEKLDCGQEWYLMLKIILKGYECYCLNQKLLKYYVHEEERISNSLKKLAGEKYLYEIKKVYIEKYPKSIQKELHYFNNIELCILCLKFNKREFLYYLKKAVSYRLLKKEDIFRVIFNIFFNQKYINKIKKAVKIININIF